MSGSNNAFRDTKPYTIIRQAHGQTQDEEVLPIRQPINAEDKKHPKISQQ